MGELIAQPLVFTGWMAGITFTRAEPRAPHTSDLYVNQRMSIYHCADCGHRGPDFAINAPDTCQRCGGSVSGTREEL